MELAEASLYAGDCDSVCCGPSCFRKPSWPPVVSRDMASHPAQRANSPDTKPPSKGSTVERLAINNPLGGDSAFVQDTYLRGYVDSPS